jgi:hypothetical protein
MGDSALSRRKKEELEKAHNTYFGLYKNYIDKLNNSPYPPVKNLCISQCRIIKKTWVEKFGFDVAELNVLDPVGIKI